MGIGAPLHDRTIVDISTGDRIYNRLCFGRFVAKEKGREERTKYTKIRAMVGRILVDRDARKAICYIGRFPPMPAISRWEEVRSGIQGAESSLNGNRTRISALRGLRPKPLDDKAVPAAPQGFEPR